VTEGGDDDVSKSRPFWPYHLLAASKPVADDAAVSFRAKWTVGALAFGCFTVGALASRSWPLVAVAGAIIAIFGYAVSGDWRGLATALRRMQWRLGLDAATYRFVGLGAIVIGVVWIALAPSQAF
jgi:hypothetical protein